MLATIKPRARASALVAALVVIGIVALLLLRSSPHHPRHPVRTSGHRTPVSGFAPLPAFAADSVWNTRVDGSSQPLDPSSPALVATLMGMVNQEMSARYGPWINTTAYSVPVYDVPANQPRVRVILDRPQPYAASLKASFAAGVPVPPDARPAAGRDEHLLVWQPATDTMWEFFHMHKMPDGWHADWGGTMQNVSHNPGYFTGADAGWGATATSLPLAGGLITPSELRAGVINHALALAIPSVRAKTWTFPAQRTDGNDLTTNSIPEGARFRIDPSLNLASLHLPPLTLMLARAAQRYGIILRDKSGVVTFYAQDPAPTGANPYAELFGVALPSTALASFPWSRLQLLQMKLNSYK
jgi:hypothetical protein